MEIEGWSRTRGAPFMPTPRNVDFALLLSCSLIRRLGNGLELPAPPCVVYRKGDCLALPPSTCCPPGLEQRRQQSIPGATNRPAAQSQKKQVKFTLQHICTPRRLATPQTITSHWWRVAPTERAEGPGCPVHPPTTL